MKISYMYTGIIGFFVTYLTAIILSYFLKYLTRFYKNDALYMDESKTLVNPELFLPPIAKLIRKRNEKIKLQNNLVNDASSSKVNEKENKF